MPTYIKHLDYAIEIAPVGIQDGYTLYLISYGTRKYVDHVWTYGRATQRAYEILDTLL
jgi:hypothetical protein